MRNLFLKLLLLFTIVSSGQSIELLHQLKKGQQRSEKAQDLSDSFTTRVNTDSGTSESSKACFEGVAYAVDQASIVLSPAGFKASKLYSVEPTDGVGDFTVVRASVATRVNSFGLVEEMAANVPRIDYSDNNCGVLLLEPQSTNVLFPSEDLSLWNSSATLIGNKIAPDGTLNAYEVVVGSEVDKRLFPNNSSGTLDAAASISFYIKKVDSVGILRITSANGLSFGNWELDLSLITSTGWVRITKDSPYINIIFPFKFHPTGGTCKPRFSSGNVGESDLTFELSSVQVEELSYPTSYIPTEGSTVTRLLDEVNSAGDSTTFNSEEGVLYCEISALFDTLTLRRVTISDGTTDNRISIYYESTSNTLVGLISVGGSIQALLTHTISDITEVVKVAFKYKLNDFSLWVNGVEVNSDGLGTVSAVNTLDELSFHSGAGFNLFYGKVKEVRVYKTALTDAQLEALTKNLIPFILIGFKRRRKTEYKLAA